ncbi:MAG: hypothetical protein ACOYOK_11460 [Pseudobdellovibrionaceae bacterium]
MKKLLFLGLLCSSLLASANELDNESTVTNQQNIEGTLVIRVDQRTQAAEVLQTNQALLTKDQAQALTQSSEFTKVASANIKSELDQDAGRSSWYFYRGYNRNYYNNCNWYGRWYQPYYTYNYGHYNYYYYGYNYGNYNYWR